MRDFEGAAGALFDCSKHDKPGRETTLVEPAD